MCICVKPSQAKKKIWFMSLLTSAKTTQGDIYLYIVCKIHVFALKIIKSKPQNMPDNTTEASNGKKI